MRRTLWVAIVIGAVVALDLFLANVLGPVPLAQAVSNVEYSTSFKGIVGNGTYQY